MNSEKRCRMRYSQYKKHYSDCATVPGSYDKDLKTIEVLVPEGRMKPSGVRGERFRHYEMFARDSSGQIYRGVYRAITEDNAVKQHTKLCKLSGYTPCEPPEGRVAHIF